MISGAGVEELKSPQGHLMRRVMVNSIGFILGFSVVFVTLGAISTEIGQLAARYKHTLSIVAGVVRQARGCIEVLSDVGAGTRFDIILPADTAADRRE